MAMMKRAAWAGVALAALGLIALAGSGEGRAAGAYTGTVSRVTDGDTFKLRYLKPNGRYASITVRVRQIDTPEASRWLHRGSGERRPAECWGRQATEAAKAKLLGKPVTVTSYGLDKQGRHLADVVLADGTDFGHWMLAEGHAAIYRGQKEYLDPEDALSWAAREAGRGMWSCAKAPGHNGRHPMAGA
jgi:micrococcal nuclease